MSKKLVVADCPIIRRLLAAPKISFTPALGEPADTAVQDSGHTEDPTAAPTHHDQLQPEVPIDLQQQQQQQQQQQEGLDIHTAQEGQLHEQLLTPEKDIFELFEMEGGPLKSFQGKPNEDPDEFMNKFQALISLKGGDTAKALPLYLSNSAYVWYANLEDAKKTDYETVKKLFLERYRLADSLKIAQRAEVFNMRQEVQESVKDYIGRIRHKANQVGLKEEMVFTAILRGLKPSIRALVTMQEPKDSDAIEKMASLIEASQADSDTQPIMAVVQELRGMIDGLMVNGAAAVASVQNERSRPSDRQSADRRVRFSDSRERSSSRERPPTPTRYYGRQQQRDYRDDGRQQQRHQGHQQRTQWQRSCDRCGGRHDDKHCKARGKLCFSCGKIGHFRSQCRSAKHFGKIENY